jgi:hypothetical protein
VIAARRVRGRLRAPPGPKEEVGDAQPAKVTPIKGTDLSTVTLSADAAKRLGIATAAVAAQGSDR